MVGQEHVTEPLSTALDAGRINHAYLFSGPRGCGKTSSARILARSLNCEQGPTPTPCGVCDSCVALAPNGPGSIDVIELDAASHGGVDDTRELRDRAFYAPAQSRYRVFIVDEAHMVTTPGFNALLKIVEEPPEHLIFVFATTEPEKVLPTIRSRTHHYPFRLLPPRHHARRCLNGSAREEEVTVDDAVYPLVIRAGGGSPRDTLSVLDQLLAGAGAGAGDVPAGGGAAGRHRRRADRRCGRRAGRRGSPRRCSGRSSRSIDAGHDPRRFATDLLERFRDLIVLQAVPDAVDHGLVDAPDDEVARMVEQSGKFGPATLTRYAEVVHAGLGEMRGATAPRLLLEVVCARLLLPAATVEEPGLLERLERLERRSDIAASPPAPGEAGGAAPTTSGLPSSAGQAGTSSVTGQAVMSSGAGQVGAGSSAPGYAAAQSEPGQASAAPGHGGDEATSVVEGGPSDRRFDRPSARPAAAAPAEVPAASAASAGPAAAQSEVPAAPNLGAPQAVEQPSAASTREESAPQPVDRPEAAAIGAADVRRVWQEIQEGVKQRKKRTAA